MNFSKIFGQRKTSSINSISRAQGNSGSNRCQPNISSWRAPPDANSHRQSASTVLIKQHRGQVYWFLLSLLVEIPFMARPPRIEYPGAYYHVTIRGNERKAIFRDERDRERLLELLNRAVEPLSSSPSRLSLKTR
jgi:hypothetical protein